MPILIVLGFFGEFMKTNVRINTGVFTYESAKSSNISQYQKLKRLTIACMLSEDDFYVEGKTIAEQIQNVCLELDQVQVLNMALECHEKGLLRDIPLFLIVESFKCKKRMKSYFYCNNELMMPCNYIEKICNTPEKIIELLSLYWKDGKKSIPAQMKKGLAKAFTRFDRHQLAKYKNASKAYL